MKVRCNDCMAVFDESEIVYNEENNTEACPHCGKIGCLMDLTDEEAQSDNDRLNELAAHFDGIESRRKLIAEFGKSHTSYMGINSYGEQVTLSISEDGIIERIWQNNHRVRVEEYDKEGYHVGESYDGRWTEDSTPIPDGPSLDKEVELSDAQLQRNDDIYTAVTKMCRVLTENDEQEFNMSIVGPIADYAAMLLTREGNKVRFPSVVQDTAGRVYIEDYYDDGEVQAI